MKGYREKSLRTFKDLRAALEQLDPDAGVRVEAAFAEFNGGGFIFIGRAAEGYIVNICDSVKNDDGLQVPAGKERWLTLKSVDEVMELILRAATRPLKAYLY